MSLHSGIDTVAIISHGVFSKTYSASAPAALAALYASFGYLEGLPQALGASSTEGLMRFGYNLTFQ